MGRKASNLSGVRVGTFIVMDRVQQAGKKNSLWICRCECGAFKKVRADVIVKNSAYCFDCAPRHPKKRPMARSKIYQTWLGIHKRCKAKPGQNGYKHYAGKGIVVCERWRSFDNFLSDMGEPPTKKHSIDRIDGSKGYEPANCRWATSGEQNRNTTRNHRITIGSETLTLVDWCERFNTNHVRVIKRMNVGWPAELALAVPALKPHAVRRIGNDWGFLVDGKHVPHAEYLAKRKST